MIKGSGDLNKVSSAITRLFCPWLNAAPPHYETQSELHRSAGTADTPCTQSPSSSSSKRPTCVFEKIRELVWGGPPAPSAHSPEMSGGFMIKLLLNNNSFIFYIVTKIWVLEWRSRAERTPSHPTPEPIRWACDSLYLLQENWARSHAAFWLWAQMQICSWAAGMCLSGGSRANMFMSLDGLCRVLELKGAVAIYLSPEHDADIMVASSKFTVFWQAAHEVMVWGIFPCFLKHYVCVWRSSSSEFPTSRQERIRQKSVMSSVLISSINSTWFLLHYGNEQHVIMAASASVWMCIHVWSLAPKVRHI